MFNCKGLAYFWKYLKGDQVFSVVTMQWFKSLRMQTSQTKLMALVTGQCHQNILRSEFKSQQYFDTKPADASQA